MRTHFAVLNLCLLTASTLAQQPSIKDQVVIATLELSGTTHVSSADLEAIASGVKGQPYGTSHENEIVERIRYGFQERGYFNAVVHDPVVSDLGTIGGEHAIAMTAEVEDGQQYRLQRISFARDGETLPPSEDAPIIDDGISPVGAQAAEQPVAGSPQSSRVGYSTQQLRGVFQIGDGDIFDADKIRQGLDDLRRLFASNGYINFAPVPNTESDDEAATVTLRIDFDEGKQFHLGGLMLDGEEPHPGDGAKLLAAWKPMEGGVYDGTKIEQWWQLAATMLPAGSRMEQMLGLKQDTVSAIVTGFLQFPEKE